MASINLSIPHSLSKDEVASRAKNLLSTLKDKYAGMIDGVTEEWNGYNGKFSLSAKGFDVSGIMSITDNAINIDGKMPMALSFFKGAIEGSIKKAAEDMVK